MKDHAIAVGRVLLLATLLALLPAAVASQGDSATVQVVRASPTMLLNEAMAHA